MHGRDFLLQQGPILSHLPGSRVAGKIHPSSDIDAAVSLKEGVHLIAEKLRITGCLTENIMTDAVDAAVPKNAAPISLVGGRILLKRGVVIGTRHNRSTDSGTKTAL
jgi:predicted nucleotidyltransferase